MVSITQFPSPCGVNIVAKKSRRSGKEHMISHVSVPLRGKYRGEAKLLTSLPSSVALFPSPCGVNIVAKEKSDSVNRVEDLNRSFRPLAG